MYLKFVMRQTESYQNHSSIEVVDGRKRGLKVVQRPRLVPKNLENDLRCSCVPSFTKATLRLNMTRSSYNKEKFEESRSSPWSERWMNSDEVLCSSIWVSWVIGYEGGGLPRDWWFRWSEGEPTKMMIMLGGPRHGLYRVGREFESWKVRDERVRREKG